MCATIVKTTKGYDVTINNIPVHCHLLRTAVRYCKKLGVGIVHHV